MDEYRHKRRGWWLERVYHQEKLAVNQCERRSADLSWRHALSTAMHIKHTHTHTVRLLTIPSVRFPQRERERETCVHKNKKNPNPKGKAEIPTGIFFFTRKRVKERYACAMWDLKFSEISIFKWRIFLYAKKKSTNKDVIDISKSY